MSNKKAEDILKDDLPKDLPSDDSILRGLVDIKMPPMVLNHTPSTRNSDLGLVDNSQVDPVANAEEFLQPTREEMRIGIRVDGNELNDIGVNVKPLSLTKQLTAAEIDSYTEILARYASMVPKLQSYLAKCLSTGLIRRQVMTSPQHADVSIRPLLDQKAAIAMTKLLEQFGKVILVEEQRNKTWLSLNEYQSYLSSWLAKLTTALNLLLAATGQDEVIADHKQQQLFAEAACLKQECAIILEQLQAENLAIEVIQPLSIALSQLRNILNIYDHLVVDAEPEIKIEQKPLAVQELAVDLEISPLQQALANLNAENASNMIKSWDADRYQQISKTVWRLGNQSRAAEARKAIIAQINNPDDSGGVMKAQLIKMGIDCIRALSKYAHSEYQDQQIELQQILFKVLNKLNFCSNPQNKDNLLGDLLMCSATASRLLMCQIADTEDLQLLHQEVDKILSQQRERVFKQ